MKEISVQELAAAQAAGRGPVLLDVREPFEVRIAALPGARHIPLSHLEERLGELDPKLPTVVFCHHGVRSRTGALLLTHAGFSDVASLAGGIDKYSVLVDPSVPRY